MERRGRVLIVDDERFNITVLSNLLSPYCETLVAKSGEQALRAVQSALPPDLILLDIMMPGMDGYEVCRRLKADEATRAIPVIFITAMHGVEDEVKGFEVGAVDYITKPISPPVVHARVLTHLENVLSRNRIHALNLDLTRSLEEQKRAYEELHRTRIELAETQAIAIIMKAFEKFVPKQFLERIAKEGLEHIKPGTVELSTITVMFSDIRSFSKLCESMSPSDIFMLLNGYLGRMQAAIDNHNGFIDKFIGDAIMALFDGDEKEQASNAARAAIGMQSRLLAYNLERLRSQRDPITIGIGLHTGPVMMGTLGNETRMDSTVIGDAANLAARLEGLTKYYDCRIVISDDVYNLLEPGQFLSRPLDRVIVKGKTQSVLIHELFDADPEPLCVRKKQLLIPYLHGLDCFYQRRWQESRDAFQNCLEIVPNDIVSQIFLNRCDHFSAVPPAEDWDGSFEMQHK
ncbi:response regulator [Candidatus Magnetaquicoccus inordinatus]|uniref:response regulator n=1 Tax=Candidatus Magnetaquicoccus inordinatus TaxID=2496818 RepID=UPI00102CC131|nr:adenylate/guanylate cyclase domain-containing protein [Candidatus Magnetaquicoccus inordinatus]